MLYDGAGKPTTGIEVDMQGRVLLWYRDQFGKLRSKHLMFVTPAGVVEWRQEHTTITVGLVRTDDRGNRYIRIDLP